MCVFMGVEGQNLAHLTDCSFEHLKRQLHAKDVCLRLKNTSYYSNLQGFAVTIIPDLVKLGFQFPSVSSQCTSHS